MSLDPACHLLVGPIFSEVSREGKYFPAEDLLHGFGTLGFGLAFCDNVGCNLLGGYVAVAFGTLSCSHDDPACKTS